MTTYKDIVLYVYEMHEWCEKPVYTDTRCGARHFGDECEDIDIEFVDKDDFPPQIPCLGCKMRKEAAKLLKK